MNNELELLFKGESKNRPEWIVGKIPKHYKRITVSESEALRLAKLGAATMGAAYGIKLYYTQSVIAGAILSDKYDEVIVVSPSQYGKSWLMGHIALYRAYMGEQMYITGAAANVTSIIMGHTIAASQEAAPEIRNALMIKKDELDRLATSVSKQKLAFSSGGFVEAITLGDSYTDNISTNKAVGRAGDFIVDEAALISDNALAEMGRREFARVDGKKYMSVMISNPHKAGTFYDKLTEEPCPERRIVIWMDALTSVEEGRWTKKLVMESDFAKHRSTMRRYLLCVLDTEGNGMFGVPEITEKPNDEYAQYFLGVDSAYKGKDNICLTLTSVDSDGKLYVDDIAKMMKTDWIDGVTSQDIIKDICRVVNNYHIANVCVDIGQGIWLVEGLAQHGIPVHGINFASTPTRERVRVKHYCATNASNMRAEMHLDLQDLIDRKGIAFSEDAYEAVKDTLPYVNCERKASGKIEIEKKSLLKQKIGRSPDELDSLILSIHAAVEFMGNSLTYIT